LRSLHEQAETSPATETAQLVRRARQATTKRYSAEDDIRVVMEGIRGDLSSNALCRRQGIHANL